MGLFFTSSLKNNKAYMLRNDGKLFEIGARLQFTHPYIKHESSYTYKDILDEYEEQGEDQLEYYSQCLNWFETNTKNASTKQMIESLKPMLVRCLIDLDNRVGELFAEQFGVKITNDLYLCSPEDKVVTDQLLNACNDATNQEFLRVRVGGMYRSTGDNGCAYFRVSSTDFDWFPLIYELVHTNRREIKDITISRDPQSCNRESTVYVHKGEAISHMATEDFLALSGTPIIEKLTLDKHGRMCYNDRVKENLANGYGLWEAFEGINPYHIHRFYKKLQKQYTKENFITR